MPDTKVKVVTRDGALLGYVSAAASSVGASKVAVGSVHYERRDGVYCWVKQ